MKKILLRFHDMTLKGKLILSFIGFIIIPLIVLNIFSTNLYSEEIQNTVIKSSIQSNEQRIKNLDTFLGILAKLSEYPMKDIKLRTILRKDYTKEAFPSYEAGKDFDLSKDLLYINIKSFSDMIDSVILYKAKTFEIRGRTPTDSLNTFFDPSREKWFEKIDVLDGAYAIIGIHNDLQQTLRDNYVISVGRSVIDPETGENLGYIVINTSIGNLEKLWMDTKLTYNSRFYVVDDNNNVVYSSEKSQLNQNIDSVFGKKTDIKKSGYTIEDFMSQKHYFISSESEISGWRMITVIPQKELLSYISVMFGITVLIGGAIILLSLVFAVFIATGVTRPLYNLNQKMKLVSKGDFDVKIDSSYGEVGEISMTVEKMIVEIKSLINKIYKEEEEKRIAEMNALQSQINPHFMYNTLNTIKWMANIQGATGIENALNSLSTMLTFTARSTRDFVPIKDEVKFIQDYLTLLNLRYYNSFSVNYEIDEDVYKFKTLKFLLQPVIENAIFHGIEGVDRKGILKISIHHESNRIVFEIEDNGKGIRESVLESIFQQENDAVRKKFNSIGIPNIQKRIKLHFGKEYGVYISSVDEQGTLVTITIPAIPVDE